MLYLMGFLFVAAIFTSAVVNNADEFLKNWIISFLIALVVALVGYFFFSATFSDALNILGIATPTLCFFIAGNQSQEKAEKQKIIDAEENRKRQLKLGKMAEEEKVRKEKIEYEEMLQRVEALEAAKSRGKAKGLAELYKTQIELMIKYKREGVNIENDIYEMRKRLLSLEREENNAMVQDLLQTLDRI